MWLKAISFRTDKDRWSNRQTGIRDMETRNSINDQGSPGFLSADDRGFTLLEVLLAFFIFAILFITVYSSYSGSFKTINMTESRMAVYRKASIVLERISEDLQASYLSVLPQNSFGKPAEYTRFLGTDSEMSGRDADTLKFFSRLQPLFSNEGEAASGQLISYSVILGDEGDELILLRSENPEFTDENQIREGLVLADGLQAVNFTYFDENSELHESWDTDSEEYKGRLPRMVSVALEFLNSENPEAPVKVMTSVALPVHYVPPQPNEQ
jgi:prepilin-type N-terminal cleavage/methylation domain-containing protein